MFEIYKNQNLWTNIILYLTLFTMSTSFSPVTSTNVGINPQKLSDFQFQPFCHTGVNLQGHNLCQSQIIERETRPNLKKLGFSVEILIKLKFSNRNASYQTLITLPHLQYNLSHVIKFVSDVMDKKYDVITFISKYIYFKKSQNSQFC